MKKKICQCDVCWTAYADVAEGIFDSTKNYHHHASKLMGLLIAAIALSKIEMHENITKEIAVSLFKKIWDKTEIEEKNSNVVKFPKRMT